MTVIRLRILVNMVSDNSSAPESTPQMMFWNVRHRLGLEFLTVKRLALLSVAAATIVLAGCSSTSHISNNSPISHRISVATNTTGTTNSTPSTIPALPPTLPIEAESNAVATFGGFTVCSLRPDSEVLGNGYDATANGTVTIMPPAGGGEVEMDIVDSSGNVIEGGFGLPTPLESYVLSPQPISLEADFTLGADSNMPSACVVHWVVPKTLPNETGTVQQPPPPTSTPSPTTYPALP